MRDGDRGILLVLAAVLVIGLAAGLPGLAAEELLHVDGYAEWNRDGSIVAAGQRVVVDGDTDWKSARRSLADVQLGDEVRVKGVRRADGSIAARAIDARPNTKAFFDDAVLQASSELERSWLAAGEALQPDSGASFGKVVRQGREVDRVRWLVRRLIPPYVDQSQVRVYVIDSPHWNAIAMGNGAIWVFRGLIDEMSDNELAVVLGHELVHYTHEHARLQFQRSIWVQAGAVAALIVASQYIDSGTLQYLARLATELGATAWMNGYGRSLEDQADRVGLRYAHEAGFDVSRAPMVWDRFLTKHGEADRVTNFFFSDHSRASERRQHLEQEIRHNYGR